MIIARQMAYHREHREKYLAYMKEYNKEYYLKHKPEPKPKPVKKAKEPRPPKLPKVVKQKSKKETQNYNFVVPEYVYPTKMATGNFILTFD